MSASLLVDLLTLGPTPRGGPTQSALHESLAFLPSGPAAPLVRWAVSGPSLSSRGRRYVDLPGNYTVFVSAATSIHRETVPPPRTTRPSIQAKPEDPTMPFKPRQICGLKRRANFREMTAPSWVDAILHDSNLHEVEKSLALD